MLTIKQPKKWKIEKLSELGKWGSGGTPLSSNKEFYGGNIKWAVIGDLNEGVLFDTQIKITEKGLENSSAKLVPEGSLLIAMYGSIGKTAITGCKLSHNQAIAFLIPDEEKTNVFYVKYFIQFVVPELFKLSRGGTQKNINQEILKNFEIPLPTKKEQNAIVAEIEKQFTRLDAAVKDLKSAKEKLEVYRKSVLESAFTGNLTKDWRKEYKSNDHDEFQKNILSSLSNSKKDQQFPSLDMEKLPKLPTSWIWSRANNICEVIANGSTPKKELMNSGSGEIPFLKIYNLTDNGILNFNKKPTFIDKKTHNSLLLRSKIYPDDILINIVGPPLGKVSIVSNAYPEWNTNQAVVIYRIKKKNEIKIFTLCSIDTKHYESHHKNIKSHCRSIQYTVKCCSINSYSSTTCQRTNSDRSKH